MDTRDRNCGSLGKGKKVIILQIVLIIFLQLLVGCKLDINVKYVSDKNHVDKKDLSEYAKQYGISQESLLKYFNDKIGISISLGKVEGEC